MAPGERGRPRPRPIESRPARDSEAGAADGGQLFTGLSAACFLLTSMVFLPYFLWCMAVELRMFNHVLFVPLAALYFAFVFVFYVGSARLLEARRALAVKLLVVGLTVFVYRWAAVVILPSVMLCASLCGRLGRTRWRQRASDAFGTPRRIAALAAVLLFVVHPVMNYSSYRGMVLSLSPVRMAPNPLYQVNAEGFRGPVVPQARSDAMRLLFLGDSTTFGFLVHQRKSYPFLVAATLEAEGAGPVEVLNTAAPGMTLAQQALSLDEYLAYQPDVIVVMTGFHYDRSIGESTRDPAEAMADVRPALLLVPPMVLEAAPAGREVSVGGPPALIRNEYDRFAEVLSGVVDRIEETGIPTLFLEYPSMNANAKVQALIKERSIERGLDYLPLLDRVVAGDGTAFDGIHLNTEGHRLVARLVVEEWGHRVLRSGTGGREHSRHDPDR